jgi:hypothetical protein
MKKFSLAFVLLALVLSGCGVKKLTLTEIRNPTSSTLGKVIITQGYFSSSSEQDMLTSEQDRYVDLVDLAIFPTLGKDQRAAKRTDLGRRLGGKLVSVSGRLKVGPYGLAGRSTVYVEVESINEATAAAE